MKNKSLIALSGLALGLFMVAGVVLAAPNPSGRGQPGAECGDENATMMPNGFSSGGFANAEEHYAGSDGTASAEHSKSGKAVSQYDVACYQLSNK